MKNEIQDSSQIKTEKKNDSTTLLKSFTNFVNLNFQNDGFEKKKLQDKFSKENTYKIIQTPFIENHKTNGLYIWGDTGTGKTHLMNLFYDSLDIQEKRFYHFNKFMLKIHRINFENTQKKKIDPLFQTARKISEKNRVIFLDEFQVTDIGDAMIMKRLFEIFWKCGVILIATSNRIPDDLYFNGIQREAFLPFIKDLKNSNDIFHIKTETDYREELILRELNMKYKKDEKLENFLFPLNELKKKEFFDIFFKYTGNKKPLNSELEVIKGRNINVSGVGRIGIFKFKYLFDSNLGASDYMAICKKYFVIFIEDFGIVDITDRNLARRVILFFDEIYNHKVKIFANSEKSVDELFVVDKKRNSEEVFMIKRCISRLKEIQTLSYFNERHVNDVKKADNIIDHNLLNGNGNENINEIKN